MLQLKVLYPDNGPDLPCDLLYRDEEIASLTGRFNVDTLRTIQAFREHKENGGREFLKR